MFKKTTTIQRINLGLSVIAFFLLILTTNRIDNNHFQIAQNAVNSVYQDRVLAQSYLFKISDLLSRKQFRIVDGSEDSRKEINKEIEILVMHFYDTNLTSEESLIVNNFRDNFVKFKDKESQFYRKSQFDSHYEQINLSNHRASMYHQINDLKFDLNKLSVIQVKESKFLISKAQKSLDTNAIISKVEVYSLLVLGVIFISIIFFEISKKSNKQKHL